MNNKRRISLMVKMILFSLGLVVISSVIIQFLSYQTAKKAIVNSVGNTALNISKSIVQSIDTDQFQELNTAQDMTNNYYTELKESLYSDRKILGLKYIYTMKKTSDGKYIYVVEGCQQGDQNAASLGDEESEVSDIMKRSFKGQGGFELSLSGKYGSLISAYIPIINKNGEVIGILGADFDATHVSQELKKAEADMLITSFVILIIGFILCVSFSYVLIRNLRKLKSKIKTVKDGDLTVQVNISSNDEVGSIADAFQSMVENMASIIRNIRNNTKGVVDQVRYLDDSVNVTHKATEDITRTVQEIATGSFEQVSNAEHISKSMENVFNEVERITKNIELVTKDSGNSVKEAEKASEILKDSVNKINVVNDTIENSSDIMKNLKEKFDEVLSFSKVVNDIADQTNLLALNATIESARAGEAGRGFGVVAGEISKLAQQADEASNQINNLIQVMQVDIDQSCSVIESGVLQAREGVHAITNVETFFDKLSESNHSLDDNINKVSYAIIEIERNSKEVYDKILELSEISKEFHRYSEETMSSTEEQFAIVTQMQEYLTDVKEIIEGLSITVNEFKVE